jgi:hypothetical protein
MSESLDHRSLDWAVEIIGMCEPIRCHQGGMWFGRNHNFADATFVDYGAADAFAVAAKALPGLVKALEQAKTAMLRTRTASIAGCNEGYGKPEKWADELFSSHGDLTASIKTIEGLLASVGRQLTSPEGK